MKKLLIALPVALGVIIGWLAVRGIGAVLDAQDVPGEVRATSIVLVDAAGKERASLTVGKDDQSASLMLLDPGGHPVVMVTAGKETSSLILHPNGPLAAGMRVSGRSAQITTQQFGPSREIISTPLSISTVLRAESPTPSTISVIRAGSDESAVQFQAIPEVAYSGLEFTESGSEKLLIENLRGKQPQASRIVDGAKNPFGRRFRLNQRVNPNTTVSATRGRQ